MKFHCFFAAFYLIFYQVVTNRNLKLVKFLIQTFFPQHAKLEVTKLDFKYNERYTKVAMNIVNTEKGLLSNFTIELFQDILYEKVRFLTNQRTSFVAYS